MIAAEEPPAEVTAEEQAAEAARAALRYEEQQLVALQRRRDALVLAVPNPEDDAPRRQRADDLVDEACARTAAARGEYNRTMRELRASWAPS